MVWIAADAASLHVLETARKVAAAATTVLIVGESGCGKDQLARWMHEHSPRRDAPFLKIDCASLPAELVESELFGHERGAFTGAVERKLGRLEMARGGTIALDEVAALAPSVQAKLLRVLEERKFERLGGSETLRMDARLVALTNADLRQAVAVGRFREDLYFRLNVVTIAVPPLRARPADIPALAAHFLARLGPLHGRPGTALAPDAEKALLSYPWPGNVRELKNALERALLLGKGKTVALQDLPEGVRPGAGRDASGGMPSLADLERDAIRATLEATRFNRTRAAEILGINRKTLLEKRKKYKLDGP
jgi:DNA-binding NtrC family response regulator